MCKPYSFESDSAHRRPEPETYVFMPASIPLDKRLARFKEIIAESKHIVFFGGAGVSTGSGIPDFRSDDGLYKNMPENVKQFQPEYLLSRQILFEHPDVFYDFYRNHMDLRPYEPNDVHKYIAKLETEGKMSAVVTQNVDMLHEKAGTKNIYKIHGTIASNRCDKCGKKYDMDYIFDKSTDIPRCDCKQHGLIRPDVVFYGEQIPRDQWKGAVQAIDNADCLIVCGTSLTVYPAANLVSEYSGKYLIIVNRDSTPYDSWADVVFNEDMNDVFRTMSKS